MRRLIFQVVMAASVFASVPAGAELTVRQSTALSGVLASSGVPMAKGAEVFFQSLNQRGGVAGQKIKFVSQDDEYKIEKTLANVQSACSDESTIVMMGGSGTANNEAIFKQRMLSGCGLAMVGPRTGALSLRDPGNLHMFHVRPTYADEVHKIIQHFETIGLKNIGVVYQDDGFGKDGLDAAQSIIRNRGLGTAFVQAYPRNTADVAQAVRRATDGNTEAILLITTTASTAAFTKAFRECGGQAYLATLSINDAAAVVEATGNLSRGLMISMPFPDLHKVRTEIVKQYLADLKRFAPDVHPSYPGLEGYIVAKVIAHAMSTSSRPNRQGMYQALQGMRDVNLGDFHIGYDSLKRGGSHYVDIGVIDRNGVLYR